MYNIYCKLSKLCVYIYTIAIYMYRNSINCVFPKDTVQNIYTIYTVYMSKVYSVSIVYIQRNLKERSKCLFSIYGVYV